MIPGGSLGQRRDQTAWRYAHHISLLWSRISTSCFVIAGLVLSLPIAVIRTKVDKPFRATFDAEISTGWFIYRRNSQETGLKFPAVGELLSLPSYIVGDLVRERVCEDDLILVTKLIFHRLSDYPPAPQLTAHSQFTHELTFSPNESKDVSCNFPLCPLALLLFDFLPIRRKIECSVREESKDKIDWEECNPQYLLANFTGRK